MSRNDYQSAAGARAGLTIMRIAMGVFFLFESFDKYPWLRDPEKLLVILRRWDEGSHALSHWYLQTVAIPGVAVFARLTFLGELAIGVALIIGLWTRVTSIVAFLLVLNIHLAHGSFSLPDYGFLAKGDALPVLASLFALIVAGKGLPLSVRRSRRSSMRR